MHYIICYHDTTSGESVWECVCGEDAMNIRVSELCDTGHQPDDILVFNLDDEIDSKSEQTSEEHESELKKRILEILDKSLALAGFKILEGNRDTVNIWDSKSDSNFAIRIEELVN